MKKIISLLLFPAFVLANESFNEIYMADIPQPALEISYKDDGNILQVTHGSWMDRVRTKEGMKYRKYEQGYNYEKKQGFIRVFNQQGDLLQETWNKNIDGGVSKEELLKAFELFKDNDIVKAQLKNADTSITIHGGFNYQDRKECELGSRCVHVFASTPKVDILAHSIVRLSDNTVAYPDFENNENIIKKEK
jgi:hypothetical protein